MKDAVKTGMNHVANYGAGGGLAYGIVKLAERFGVTISAEEAIFIASACLWVWHRIRPLFNAVYQRVLKWAGAALLVLVPMTAEATDLAIGVRCQDGYTFTSSAAGIQIDGCTHNDLELDVLIGGQIVGVLLTGEPGKLVSIGGASLGLKFVYQPKEFALPEAVGLFLTLTGSLINIAGEAMSDGVLGRFEGLAVFGITALGFWYGGAGPYVVIDGGRVYVDAVLSTGFTLPI